MVNKFCCGTRVPMYSIVLLSRARPLAQAAPLGRAAQRDNGDTGGHHSDIWGQ